VTHDLDAAGLSLAAVTDELTREGVMTFETRREAGRQLAAQLQEYAGSDTVVEGMSDGGLTVAAEIAEALNLPLDVLVVHKIVEPGHTRTHLGAVAEPGHVTVNADRLGELEVMPGWWEDAVAWGETEVRRRGTLYRGRRERQDIAGRRVILISDSAGTGLTLRAAVKAIRAMGAREIIVALPVAPASVVDAVRPQVARVVCLATPAELIGRGIHYPPADEIGDDDIRRLLESGVVAVAAPASPFDQEGDGHAAGTGRILHAQARHSG
jgi:putative phosphoribosyl transferase